MTRSPISLSNERQVQDAIIEIASEVFFPEPTLSAARSYLLNEAHNASHEQEFAHRAFIKLSSLNVERSLTREAHLDLSCGFCFRLRYGLLNWARGNSEEVLEASPVQELIQVITDQPTHFDMKARWIAAGGRPGPRMVALKTDILWSQVSEVGLPFGPFDLEGHWDVEDVLLEEAQDLGLPVEKALLPSRPTFDPHRFRLQLTEALTLRKESLHNLD